MSFWAIEYSITDLVQEIEHSPWCLLLEVRTKEEALQQLECYREQRDRKQVTGSQKRIFRVVWKEGKFLLSN